MRPAFAKFIIALLVNPVVSICHGGCTMNWFPITPKELTNQSDPKDADFVRRREQMVREQLQARDITDAHVISAILQVPRHAFVPSELINSAYTDNALPLQMGQTISQPYIVAYMTQALDLYGTERVLEIGTGSGYQTAVLAEIVKEVYTIEILPELQKQASTLLWKLGYRNIRCKTGDGYLGWPEYAPFDRIIVTAAPENIPEPLLDQLKVGGRLVIPVGTLNQDLMIVEKGVSGIIRRSAIPVRFVPMTGKAQEKQ
jgi:protein-L-isoaspartate(D-aspartate) O-methyltransferase